MAFETEGINFDDILRGQFKKGLSDRKLAYLHQADAKWIARKRRELGFEANFGRPTVQTSDEEILDAYRRAGQNLSEAARLLGVDRKTFKARYEKIPGEEKYSKSDDDTADGSEF